MKNCITLFAAVIVLISGCTPKEFISDKVNGLDEPFIILRPAERHLETVNSHVFGMAPNLDDNTEAFNKAIRHLKNNPGTKLKIDKGTYYFSESNKIIFDGLNRSLIDGSDARFIFRKPGLFFQISHCDIFEIKGLTIDVDRVGNPLDDIIEIRNISEEDNTVEFVFINKEDVPDSVFVAALSVCDEDGYTFGKAYPSKNKEIYTYKNPKIIKRIEKIDSNVLRITHNGRIKSFENGDKVILRYHVYDGQVFHIGGESSNLTFNGIKVYGGYGCGFVVGGLTHHYQIINSTIGVDPEDTTKAQVSLGADGVHIAGSGGYFRMEGCDISRQGDDAINIHDGIGYIYQIDSNRIYMFSSQTRLVEGEPLAFKDSSFTDLGIQAKIVSYAKVEGGGPRKEVVLDKDLSAVLMPGYIAYSTTTDSGHYVIRNNYFHENRARALLLQSSNGICEGNRFYKVQGQAIKVVMDILPYYWQEGIGVENLIIRNNSFNKCDFSGWGEQITINTNIDGHTAKGSVFKNIEITGNTFSGVCREVIDAMNVDSLIFTGNRWGTTGASEEEPVRLRDWCTNCNIATESN